MTLYHLQGFRMLMAVSQDAINKRLSELAIESHNLPTTWSLPATGASLWRLKVEEFEPPQIDFNTPTEQGCRLIMGIKRGRFTSSAPAIVHGNLEIQPVDIDLAGVVLWISASIKQLVEPHPDRNILSAAKLFVDLENLSHVEFDSSRLAHDVRAKVGTAIKTSLQNLIFDELRRIAKAKPNALIFGQVNLPDKSIPSNNKEIFPTAVTFSVFKQYDQLGNYLTGSINYLLWFGDPAQIPRGPAVGVFNHNWVTPGQEATLVIHDAIYLIHFFYPALAQKYPGMRMTVVQGSYGGGVKGGLALSAEYPFPISGLSRVRYTIFHVAIHGSQIRIDYEYRFRHKSVGTWDNYKATGYSMINIYWQNGRFASQIHAPQPAIKSTDSSVRNFFKDMGKGILAAGSLGIAADSLFTSDAGAYSRPIGVSGLNQEVSLVPELFQLPGNATFQFTGGRMDDRLYVDCRYRASGA